MTTLANVPLKELTIGGLHDSLLAHLPALSLQSRILDIGCGTGAWLAKLAGAGFSSLCGLDRNTQGFAFGSAQVRRCNLDAEECPFAGEFDLISAIEVVEHLENPGRLFAMAARLLSPGGCLLITTPNIHSVFSRLRFLVTGHLMQFDQKGDPTHLFPVLPFTLDRIVERHGLRVCETWTFPEREITGCRLSSKVAARLLGCLLPNLYPGHNLCFLIRRR
jgi:SAM-dependent methyltransferase